MAFGFGFKKQKVLSAAEKCVQQGKLHHAISEYEKILKKDANDLTVLNTIGDLYARLGEGAKAAECFKSVGNAYASQGFTVKAIAIYKKLSKLKPSTECVLRLAELYTQQGLFNDARAQYLHVAEEFLKSGQLEQAVRIFEKTLEMDPDNVPMRKRLADVYIRLGKKAEAWQILTAAAESLKARGQLAAAGDLLERMLKIEPGSSYVSVLRGRVALEAGNPLAAIESLASVADLDNNPEGLRTLFQAYLRAKKFSEAGALADKLAAVHNDGAAIAEYADALVRAQQYRNALDVYEHYSDQLLRSDPAKLLEAVRPIISHVQEDPQGLEIVLELFQKAGESTHVTEVCELLAHAYVQAGNLEKARQCYRKLSELEPANAMHARNYQQVVEKLGGSDAPHLITAEEGAMLADELEASAPFIEQRYADEVSLALRAALTDAELYISYNMPAKALAPLVSALPKAPRDLRLNQKLAALHIRAGRLAETATCCRTLESLYHESGYAEEATRYGDLAARYEERAKEQSSAAVHKPAPSIKPAAAAVDAVSQSAAAARQAAPPLEAAKAAPGGLFFHAAAPSQASQGPAFAHPEFSVLPHADQEDAIDLSAEWEEALEPSVSREFAPGEKETPQVAETPAHGAKADAPRLTDSERQEMIEEARFYLVHGMAEQAEQVVAKLEALSVQSAEIAVLRTEIESAKRAARHQPPAEILIEDPTAIESVEESEAPLEPAGEQAWPTDSPRFAARAAEPRESLGEIASVEPVTEPVTASAGLVPSAAPEMPSGTLDEFVSELEDSLGDDFFVPPTSPAEATVAAAPSAPATVIAHLAEPRPREVAALQPLPAPSAAAAGVDLSNLFGDLKQELEGDATRANEQDAETHYNLGVAFREMGLLDEAIAEFQKVCKASERGHPFPQIMQTYTWLAQCFLDQGVPEAAIRWYEEALKLPALDQETRTALHYELASSFEAAGNNSAALNNFLAVYGSNIDYRDVAERIKALRP
ncbi:MAG: tetratricopeptide repeat protein [Acidobacteria bacterium]|nr:tetratricopeptide repeat protein [Acidobacteriota bacterium]